MEDPSTQGTSHFLEHLLFNGTPSRTQEQLYADLDAIGAYHNATTRRTHMALFLLVGPEALGSALRIQTEMLFQPSMTPEKFEKERGIILEELARDPAEGNAAQIELDLFGPQGYGLPVLGTERSIRRLSGAQIASFHDRFYTPENVTWIVVGDVSARVAVDSLRTIVGAIAPRATSADEPPPPPVADGWPHDLRSESDRGALSQVWVGPDPKSPEFLGFRARVEILGEGESSPVAARLTEAMGDPPTSYSCRIEEFPGFSLVRIEVELPPGRDPRAWESALQDALSRVQLTPQDRGGLDAWRVSQETDEEYLREKPHYYGILRGESLVARGLAATVGELDALRSLRPEQVPLAPLPWPPTRRARVFPAGEEPVSTSDAETVEWDLPNGAHVVVRSSPESPVLAAHLFVRDRAEREGVDHAGQAELVHSLLGRATRTVNASALRLALDEIGARIQTCDDPSIPYDDHYSRPEFSFVRFQTLDRFAEPGFELLAQIVGQPEWTDDEAARELQALRSRRVVAAGSAREAARRCAAEQGWTDNRSVLGPPEGPPEIAGSELQSWAGDYLDPAGWLVVIASGLPIESLRPLLDRTLGAVPSPSATRTTVASPTPWSERASVDVVSAERGRAVHGAGAAMAAEFAEISDPSVEVCRDSIGAKQAYVAWWRELDRSVSHPTALLANAVLSERIAFQLREREGLAYSIGSQVTRAPDRTPVWVATASTRPENAERLARGYLEVVRGVASSLPDDAEIRLAAARMEGRERMRKLTRMNWAFQQGLELLEIEPPAAPPEPVEPETVRRALRDGWTEAPSLLVIVK